MTTRPAIGPADDAEYERFLAMSEEEIESELQKAIAEYNAWWDTMTPTEQYQTRRARRLKICRRWRRLYRENHDLEFFGAKLAEAQRTLVKLRKERTR